VLGPLLFNVFINVLPLKIKSLAVVIMFADDTSIPVCHSDCGDFKRASNHALLHICEWFQSNHMMLNVEKTIIVRFTPTKFSHYPLNLVYADQPAIELGTLKYFGLWLDNHFTWKPHIDFLLCKLALLALL